jgi:hypothetical protein
MSIVHKLATTTDESYKFHTNKSYTIPRWDITQELVVLVQA